MHVFDPLEHLVSEHQDGLERKSLHPKSNFSTEGSEISIFWCKSLIWKFNFFELSLAVVEVVFQTWSKVINNLVTQILRFQRKMCPFWKKFQEFWSDFWRFRGTKCFFDQDVIITLDAVPVRIRDTWFWTRLRHEIHWKSWNLVLNRCKFEVFQENCTFATGEDAVQLGFI